MADDRPLAERLLAGDKRALARGISLVEDDDPEGWALVRAVYPHTGERRRRRLHRPARRGQVDPDRRARRPPAQARSHGRGALDRPQLAVPRRRAARRSHPALRALPRPRRLHPLDGHARRARRARRGRAADGAPDGRRRARRRVPRDGRRRPGRGRRDRPRRLRGARADPRLGRLDPGAQGGRDGDPGRDRGQQGRPPAHRHDGARDPRRAVARAVRGRAGPSRSSRRRRPAATASRSSPRSSPSTARSSSPRACCPSAAAGT